MNRLATETSPYLRQHADNPVDWYPWGDDAFAAARERDVPILLSVGYSACHWCHVMAHESFEDPEIAALMNRLFVNVKVDREERPDVDAVYMEATQALTGSGGWPMTVFMDHDGAPFHCGTYYPPSSRRGMPGFAQLCEAVDDAWTNRRDALADQAQRLVDFLRREPDLSADDARPTLVEVDAAVATLLGQHDPAWGGFGTAPKFPQSMAIDLLLRHVRRAGSPESAAAAQRSLDAMAAGGIHDHLGGGFARYSVDREWLVPHFEKMLYDNALLIRPYLHSWQLTGRRAHLAVVEGIVEYLLRDLRVDGGAFASAEDADSPDPSGKGVEGEFYVWTLAEIRDALGDGSVGDGSVGDAAEEFATHYGVTERGNFEGRSILVRPIGRFDEADDDDQRARLAAGRATLLARRSGRPRPGLDDKVLTEWNALAVASLAEAAAATGRDDWTDAAERCAEFLVSHLRRADGRWLRSWQADGGARHLAYAHDHAALVDAFVRLYEATGRLRWLDEARTVALALLDLFWDDENAGYYTSGHDAPTLVARPKDLMDNATPSPASVATAALLRLAALVGPDDTAASRFESAAHRVLAGLGATAAEHPLAFANLVAAVELDGAIREVVVTGDRADLVAEVRSSWRPDVVVAWGERGEGSLWLDRADGFAYVCEGHVCRRPVDRTDDLAALLAS